MWRVAPSDVRWTASLVDAHHLPKQWGDFAPDGTLRLKDTRGKYWCNSLVSPNTFLYRIPRRSNREWEGRLLTSIHKRVGTQVPLRVKLFATPGSRNESYGEWVVSEMATGQDPNVTELTLKRLHTQPQRHVSDDEQDRYRSRNEARHADLLATRFFPGWIVRHEPETLLDLHDPSVVDGVARSVTEMSRSYTCDFVVASRTDARRICIESKPSRDAVTEEALAKCRVLRDRTLTRVLFMVGGGEPEWLDMKDEVWHRDFSTLVL